MENELFEMAKELQLDLDARRRRKIFAESRGPQNIEEAYALQRALRKYRESRGEKVIGFKIGFTSAGVRQKASKVMGLYESVHGYLWDSESFPNNSRVDHRRLGIEGELLITLLSIRDQDPRNWEIAYEPVIELHIVGASDSTMWDGPAIDNEGKRGLELIGSNCIHAGVIRASSSIQCKLAEVPTLEPLTVQVNNKTIERVTLAELKVGDLLGPLATFSWLLAKLESEKNGEERLIKTGSQILCSTPGALHRVFQGDQLAVNFQKIATTCRVN